MIKKILRTILRQIPFFLPIYWYVIDQLFRKKFISTPWGFKLCGNPSMAKGEFEKKETAKVRELLGNTDLFINIGANIGYYCCHALSLGVPVIAAEPNPQNLQFLLANIKENGWSKRAQIYPVAIGNNSDILEIWGRSTGSSLIKGWGNNPTNTSTLTPVLKLDFLSIENYGVNKRPLILMDVEGFELLVLQGAINTINSRSKPIWIIEISLNEHYPNIKSLNPNFIETFNLLFSYGYKAYTLDNMSKEISVSDVNRIAKHELTVSTHNYIFK
jgi:FkbM family methyltransferase